MCRYSVHRHDNSIPVIRCSMGHLAKARRCCSPRDSMLAQSAVVSKPRPPSLVTRSRRGPSCTCRSTWPMSWSEGTALVLLEGAELVLVEPFVLDSALDVASLHIRYHVVTRLSGS